MITLISICMSVLGGGLCAALGLDVIAGLAAGCIVGQVAGLALDCYWERSDARRSKARCRR